MSDHVDYEKIRNRILTRRAPYRPTRKKLERFIIYLIVFLIGHSSIFGIGSYDNPVIGVTQHYAQSTLIDYNMYANIKIIRYPLVLGVYYLAGLFLFLYIVSALWACLEELSIQREIRKEADLERMRLEIMWRRERRRDALGTPAEKPKRSVTLSDDGELLYDPDVAPLPDDLNEVETSGADRRVVRSSE